MFFFEIIRKGKEIQKEQEQGNSHVKIGSFLTNKVKLEEAKDVFQVIRVLNILGVQLKFTTVTLILQRTSTYSNTMF